nr:hypothetical protein [Uliginosibacterium gangwonense]
MFAITFAISLSAKFVTRGENPMNNVKVRSVIPAVNVVSLVDWPCF